MLKIKGNFVILHVVLVLFLSFFNVVLVNMSKVFVQC